MSLRRNSETNLVLNKFLLSEIFVRFYFLYKLKKIYIFPKNLIYLLNLYKSPTGRTDGHCFINSEKRFQNKCNILSWILTLFLYKF